MCRNGGESGQAGRALRSPVLAVLALVLALAAAPLAAAGTGQAVSSPHETGIELTAPVQQALQQLQEQWLQWSSANDRERAASAVDALLATGRQLGMRRLPDLALGALLNAVRLARQGEMRRAGWALEAAERLDPGRPETAFAAAAVDRVAGRWPAAFLHLGKGYLRVFGLPLERGLWLDEMALWGLYLLLATGGLFIAVQMATKGGALFRDLAGFLARRLPKPAALVVGVALLAWPLALPAGPIWLLFYWSVLLWGYASTSERTVLAALWLLVGGAPFLIAGEHREVSVGLSPPAVAMENLAERRLYGGLFADLGVLRSILPENTAVKHLIADLHRTLGQWDLARALYRQVLEREPNNTSALLDLGVYFFDKGDYGNAIQNFQKAAASDPRNAAAPFDLSQAYAESYHYDEQHLALTRAQEIDEARVGRWIHEAESQRVVAADGGIARIPEIRRQLVAIWGGREALTPGVEMLRRGLSVALAAGLLLFAVALHLVRRPRGYTEPPLYLRLGGSRLASLRRALLPGLPSAEAGQGGKTFLALLVPVALLMLPLFGDLGYRIPWGYDPGSLMPWVFAVLGLVIYLLARLRSEQRNQV
ncbi:MAG TPA: tetratricopeptide repeat protein [Thermoanaerobaculia bacterium]